MALKIISLRVPVEVLHACGVAAAAEGCSRSAWMVRALESALSEAEGDILGEQAGPAPVVLDTLPSGTVRPASPRASALEEGRRAMERAVNTAAQGWAMDRQRKLNAGKEKRA